MSHTHTIDVHVTHTHTQTATHLDIDVTSLALADFEVIFVWGEQVPDLLIVNLQKLNLPDGVVVS
jgi:hypothetical protein